MVLAVYNIGYWWCATYGTGGVRYRVLVVVMYAYAVDARVHPDNTRCTYTTCTLHIHYTYTTRTLRLAHLLDLVYSALVRPL